MSFFKLLVVNVRTHILVWIAVVVYVLVIDPIKANTLARVMGSAALLISFISSFYLLAVWIIPSYWRRNYVFFSLFAGLGALFFFLAYMGVIFYLVPFVDPEFVLKGYDTPVILTNTFILYIALGIAAFSYYFNKLNAQKQKEQHEHEKLMIAKELNFLKSQFNSHITFNFLNFCYSHVHKSSKEAAEAIELFSDMLRYSLTQKPDEKVSISSEIEYINHFISLQKILSNQVYVEFTYRDVPRHLRVLPLMLITLVENAFKHGQYNDPARPIRISLEERQDRIAFSVVNKVAPKAARKTGIGQKNLMQLLNLHYPGNFKLTFHEEQGEYSAFLELKT